MSFQRKNIPVFIPHIGCPNTCVFCNQRSISGCREFHAEEAETIIKKGLETLPPETEAEIAFFGGSFTGIDPDLRRNLLTLAQRYVGSANAAGSFISGIRFSTRPDYIDKKVLDELEPYSIHAIELGLQSMDDTVLNACQRGHTSEQAREAVRAIRERGKYELVAQMMIGLPLSTPDTELATAREIGSLGVDGVRIYPTVVFYGTELCRMAEAGLYRPLCHEEAVERSARVLEVFVQNRIPVLRIGLCASENLSSPEQVYGGANHPALGEEVLSRCFRNRCEKALAALPEGNRKVFIRVSRESLSQALGQHRKNLLWLRERLAPRPVEIHSKEYYTRHPIPSDGVVLDMEDARACI